ncbi:transmembrane protein [Novymonas esmeraldas]|uniref:Transmembrane protein n=1 Tax=Novymonas esmeraldas TaxID=1808958 RepID=A0AAW0FA75_9TRYP
MRRCATLCTKAAAGAAAGASTPSNTAPVDARTNAVFQMRQAPTSLYVDAMHSNTLTDHPLTHRSSRDELAYRKRKLTERGQYEQAAKAEEEATQRDREGRAGTETKEYYWAMGCAVLGYLAAHSLVFNYYYPDDLRPTYSPDRGYSDDVAARREELEAVDELVGLSVLESVYSKRKAVVKRRLDGG